MTLATMGKFGFHFTRLAPRFLLTICIILASYVMFVTVFMKSKESPSIYNVLEVQQERQSNVVLLSDFDQREQTVPKLSVMILSSMPRSGSTLLGELIKTKYDDVKYYFEPDQYLERSGCLKNDECTADFFKNLYKCNENKDFSMWFKAKKFFFQFYDVASERCAKGKNGYKSCVASIDLLKDCMETPLFVVKNIRTRLKAIGDLLSDKELNFKVVHLTRDPRGSLASIKKFQWNIPEATRCEGQLQDMMHYDALERQFPNKITNITYESLCLDPRKATVDLFGFLFDNKTLPLKTQEYLEQHYFPKTENKGTMSTVKDSKSHFDSWRYKIQPSYLEFIENEKSCRAIIAGMRHTLFGSKSAAMNKSISVFES